MPFFDSQHPVFFILATLVSSVGLWAIVATQHLHGEHSHDTSEGPQKFHSLPTPRIGGLAIALTLFGFSSFISSLALVTIIAALPAFLAGLLEDLTKRVSPRSRLIATFISAIVAWWLTGYHITSLDISFIDSLLVYLPLSLLFTSFAVAGVAHAVNMIDGFNGLAGGTLFCMIGAFTLIAYSFGDLEIVSLGVLILSVLASFLFFNFPFGKIFMGDGGAYLMGFLVAWIAVMLPMRHPDVSPWASLVICSYPVNEALFSIGRRALQKMSLGQPDSEHLHSLIKKNIIRPNFSYLEPHFRNSMVAPLCWLYALVPIILAVTFYESIVVLIAIWIGSIVLYMLLYWFVARLAINKESLL
uniref:Putative glycosyl transferase, family 4 n=1 Tax=Chlorobium chlorochromatii (strain CaD3) TaxID=340177 RepID=Q3ASV5_CHLCH